MARTQPEGNSGLTQLEQAIMLAVQAHGWQIDKVGRPYILHPLRVMLALGWEAEEEIRIIAVLHDVVEDHPGLWSIDDIRNQFGDRVADGMDAISRRPSEAYQDYLNRVYANPDARKVKLADLVDNLTRDRVPAHFWAGMESLWKKYDKAFKFLSI